MPARLTDLQAEQKVQASVLVCGHFARYALAHVLGASTYQVQKTSAVRPRTTDSVAIPENQCIISGLKVSNGMHQTSSEN